MKYWLDLNGDNYTLYEAGEDEEEVCSGRLSDLGIGENDPDYTNKLDDYFEKEHGIAPSEWEVG